MAKFVVDLGVVLELARTRKTIPAKHTLLAPTLLRSQALSTLHEAVQRGELSDEQARERLAYISQMKIRLLGDAHLRQNAWKIADELGWDETYVAEYVALARVQRSTLVTLDRALARTVEGIVPTASLEALS